MGSLQRHVWVVQWPFGLKTSARPISYRVWSGNGAQCAIRARAMALTSDGDDAKQASPPLMLAPASESSWSSASDSVLSSCRVRPNLVPRLSVGGGSRGISKPKPEYFTKARILKDPPDYRPVFDTPSECTRQPSLLTAARPHDFGGKALSVHSDSQDLPECRYMHDRPSESARQLSLLTSMPPLQDCGRKQFTQAEIEDVADKVAAAVQQSQQTAVDGLSLDMKSYLEALESRLTVQYVVLGERVQGCSDLINELKDRPPPEALPRCPGCGSGMPHAGGATLAPSALAPTGEVLRISPLRRSMSGGDPSSPHGQNTTAIEAHHGLSFAVDASVRSRSESGDATLSHGKAIMRQGQTMSMGSLASSDFWGEFDEASAKPSDQSQAWDAAPGRLLMSIMACKACVIGFTRDIIGDPVPGTVLHTLSQSPKFNNFGILMTLGNCVLVAIDTDSATTRSLRVATGADPGVDPDAYIALLVQRMFLGWFTLEVLVQFLGMRIAFFIGPDRWWNFLDVSILGASLFAALGSPLTTSYVRALRIARATRAMRAARFIRCSDSLRRITSSVSSVFFSLFWTACLMLIIVYVMGVMMMEGVATSLDSVKGALSEEGRVQGFEGHEGADLVAALQNYYGDIGRTSFTLFRGITGGDWGAYAAPLSTLNSAWAWVWLVYIFVVVFGAANIVTGLIVNIIRQPLVTDRAIQAEAEAQDEASLGTLFRAELARVGRYGEEALLSQSFFDHMMKRPSVTGRLKLLGIEIDQMKDPFLLVDLEGMDKVTPELAARRVLHLRGAAKAEDVTRISWEVSRIKSDVFGLVTTTHELRNYLGQLMDESILHCKM